jgi:uncharacterized FlaG/YvyC family protein
MEKNLINVEGHLGDLARDPSSGAILNINKTEIQNAREAKRIRQQKALEEKNLKETVDRLQSEMSDIKRLLSTIVEKL